MIINVLYTFIEISELQGHFINKYASVYRRNKNKNFIDLVYVIHERPKLKTLNEANILAKLQVGGSTPEGSRQRSKTISYRTKNTEPNEIERITSKVYTTKNLTEIFTESLQNSSVILFEGAPGIGKTMAAKEIAHRWAKREMLHKIELLLLVYCRELQEFDNFNEFLKDISTKSAEYITSSSNGKGLMIIFDGYDELPKTSICARHIHRLISKETEILEECCIIITSRSHTTACLLEYLDCRIEIFGFSEENRFKYLKELNLSDNELDNIFKCLKENHIINSLCYIPLHLSNLVLLAQNNEKLDKLTQTELTGKSIDIIIKHNIKRNSLSRIEPGKTLGDPTDIKFLLGKLAYEMIEKERLLIYERDIVDAGLPIRDAENHNVYGLLQSVQFNELVEEERYYNFTHFSIQEYLAAFHLVNKERKIIKKMHDCFWEPKYSGIWKMYIGITKGKDLALKQFLTGESFFRSSFRHIFKLKTGIAKSISCNKIKCLQLFQMFLEAPESEIINSLSFAVEGGNIYLSKEELHLKDINILAYFIAKSYIRMNWRKIDLSYCKIDDENCQALQHGLSLDDGRKKPIIQSLILSHNKIKKLSTLINLAHSCQIESLEADNVGCTVDDSSLSLNSSLKELDLSSNFKNKANQSIVDLCNILIKHEHLKKLRLRKIHLDRNDTATSALFSLYVQLNDFESLECDDDFVSSTIKQIRGGSVKFDNDTSRIKMFLEVSKYDHMICSKFANYLSKIVNLSLECTTEKRNEIEFFLPPSKISYKIFQRFSILAKLNLSGIKVNEEACKALNVLFERNVCSLRYLIMNRCNLTTEIGIAFFQKLKCVVDMNELQLCHNFIADKATVELGITLLHWNSLKTLKIDGNQFTEYSKKLFSLFLHELHEDELKIIKFDDLHSARNFINLLHHALRINSLIKSHFVTNVQNVHTLNINQISTNSYLRDHLSDALINISDYFMTFMKLVELNLSGLTINHMVASKLASAFERNLKSTLQVLRLSSCKLNSATIAVLAKSLRFVKDIKVIDISSNNIGDDLDAMKELIITIIHLDYLQEVNFDGNDFNDFWINLLDYLLTIHKWSNLQLRFTDSESICFFLTVLSFIKNVSNTDSHFVKNILKVTEVQLFDLTIAVEASHLDCLSRFQNIKVLNMTQVIITTKVDISCISNLTNLEHLTMNYCGLKSETVIKFIHCIQPSNDRKLKVLQLDNNIIDDRATESLIMAILTWNSFESVSVVNNRFSTTSLALLDLLQVETSINTLNINSDLHLRSFLVILNNVTSYFESSEVFSNNIQKIKELSISCNRSNPLCNVEDLAYFSNLKKFSLYGLNINESAMSDLIFAFTGKEISAKSSIKCSHLLVELSLNHCQISSNSVKMLCTMLSTMPNINKLDLSFNSIDDEAAYSLVTAFLQMTSLSDIHLENNEFEEYKNFQEICNIIIQIKKITSSISVDAMAFIKLLNIIKDDINKQKPYLSDVYNSVRCLNLQNSLHQQITLSKSALSFIQQCPNLIELRLHGIYIDFTLHSSATVAKLRCLENLTVVNCGLTSDSVKKLFSRDNRFFRLAYEKLKVINLEHNQITDDIVYFMISIFAQMPNLSSININENDFKEHKNFQEICKVFIDLKDNENRSLIVYNTKDDVTAFLDLLSIISDDIDKQNSNLMRIFTKLKYLKLLNCHHKPIKLTNSALLLLKNCTNLIELELNGILFSSSLVPGFAEVLSKRLNCLEHLSLINCGITSECVETIISCDPQYRQLAFKKLKTINLQDNDITDDAIGPLVKSFLQIANFAPETLQLGSNQSTDLRMKIIFQLLCDLRHHRVKIEYSNNNCVSEFLYLMDFMNDISPKTSRLVDNCVSVKKLILHYLHSKNLPKLTKNSTELLSKFTHLERLSFTGICISSNIAIILAKALNDCRSSLTTLTLNHCQLDLNVADALRIFVENNTVLSELNLPNNEIESKGAIALAEALSNCKRMKRLNLSSNNIKDDAMDYMVAAFPQMPHISCIDLQHNQLTDEAIGPVVKALLQMPNATKETLQLDHNQVTVLRMQAIFDIMNDLKLKKTIDYSSDKETVKYVPEFLNLMDIMNDVPPDKLCLVKSLVSIEMLSLRYLHEEQTVVLTKNAAKFIERFSKLTHVKLQNIYIELDTAIIFANTLESSKSSLKTLSLVKCGLDFQVADALCELFKSTVALTELNLSENNLEDRGSIKLLEGLANCKRLKAFYISFNNITDDATLSLQNFVSIQGCLTSIDLKNNKLSQQSLNMIYEAAPGLSSL